jgi:hypothetical protein
MHKIYSRAAKYVTNQATRIVIKAAGDLSTDKGTNDIEAYGDEIGDGELYSEEISKRALDQVQEIVPHVINVEAYKPIVDKDRIWILSELDLG